MGQGHTRPRDRQAGPRENLTTTSTSALKARNLRVCSKSYQHQFLGTDRVEGQSGFLLAATTCPSARIRTRRRFRSLPRTVQSTLACDRNPTETKLKLDLGLLVVRFIFSVVVLPKQMAAKVGNREIASATHTPSLGAWRALCQPGRGRYNPHCAFQVAIENGARPGLAIPPMRSQGSKTRSSNHLGAAN